MRFIELLSGAFRIEPEPIMDERGFFARVFAENEFTRMGLESKFPEWSKSYNRKKDTLRGMHYQDVPFQETKLIACVQGAVYDVIADVRKGSETFAQWKATELSAENNALLYVPKGFAHGYVTITDDAVLFYHISAPYRKEYARGVRWNDPDLAIIWPITTPILSDKDKNNPALRELFS